MSALLLSSPASARDLVDIHIDQSEPIITCDISPTIETKKLIKALHDGSSISFSWDIIIKEILPYWFNQDAGTVLLHRQARADLVSKQWVLGSSHNSISQKVASPAQAIQWLSSLHKFPMIDKSLLKPNTIYRVRIKLYIKEGEISQDWWNNIIPLGKTIGITEFTLP
ncbi:MAG: DUF4390 domain-containing protein [Mariprofundaceae bacterium]